eukprot:TRINITY_DN7754_c0_g1_i5.p1 TRINITY_DN7754_c0_g1~~TRINITY_DN7754_c0_g1_i5.p1  ORF type:complete len:131 (-),score=13.11 TRINITY_DN7754_c0_g1_i5:37-429(-)
MTSGEDFIKKEKCVYTYCYCEENVWKLAETLKNNGYELGEVYAVIVSNQNKTIPIWKHGEGFGPVVWDYHVLLIDRGKQLAYDLDAKLDTFPCMLSKYVEECFKPIQSPMLPKRLQRNYRVIQALSLIHI